MNTFDFNTQLVMSAGVSIGEDVGKVLLSQIPGSIAVTKANVKDDRSGTDYWIEHKRGTPISVDTKIRPIDPVQSFGRDDLMLERWSVVGKKIGWTLDEEKRTDYVLWWFKPTRRWALLPFLQLQAVFTKRQDEWIASYDRGDKDIQFTRGSNGRPGWHSQSLVVPRRTIWAAIYTDFGGGVVDVSPPALKSQQTDRVRAAADECEDCERKSIVTITVVDRVGPRVLCSKCWRDCNRDTNHAQDQQIGGAR